MTIVVAGGSGFLGGALVDALSARGDDVVVLSRRAGSANGGVRTVGWQPDGGTGPWAEAIDGADAVVNLTGAGMADRRWTRARKRVLHDSRVLPARSLAAAIRDAPRRPGVFVQGSAVGYYGAHGDETLDESAPPGPDFLGRLCVAWEAEAHAVSALDCRLVLLRSGIGLARGGGVLGRLVPPFLFFGGGPVASGRQYVSWIHRDDWVALALWAMDTASASGAINATSPNPVTNEVFSRALGRALRRPSWLRMPAFALRLIFGEMADVMLASGQRVVPARAVRLGFTFAHPDIDAAMRSAIRGV